MAIEFLQRSIFSMFLALTFIAFGDIIGIQKGGHFMKSEIEKRKATFSVPENILRDLERLSRATGYNKSVLVALALEQFIRKEAGRRK